jgi:putative transposase
MTNHVHLLVTGQDEHSISKMMKRLGESYVRRFNKIHQRTGTLWEGRFRSSVVDTEHYVLACYRYIESNPVRAGIVSHPEQYRWSSFGANALGERDDLARPHECYLALATSIDERKKAYRALFACDEEIDELARIRAALNGGFALGSKDFTDRIEQRTGRRAERMTKGRVRESQDAARLSIEGFASGNSGLTPV